MTDPQGKQTLYTYDGRGNITTITGMTNPHTDSETLTSAVMTYDADNRLATYNGKEIKYDADGNMTYGCLNGRMVYLDYDCRNRLTCVKDHNGTTLTRYEYDAENVRTAVIEGNSRTVYVTDREAPYSQILTATAYKEGILATGKPTAQTLYTYGLGLISEHRNPQEAEEETYYYHYNHLGSTTAVTDKQGTITYRFAYDTYGELTDIRDADYHSLKNTAENEGYTKEQLAQAIGITFLYNGQYGVQTDANGLYYMRARYYSQDIKRFINRDVVTGSITNSQSLNRYSYVQGNPVKLTDPFGLCPDSNSAFKNLCKAAYHFDWAGAGHTALAIASCFYPPLSFVNAAWYAKEGNIKEAVISGLFGFFGSGAMAGAKLMCNPATAGAGAAISAVSIGGLGGMGLAFSGEMISTGVGNLIAGLKDGKIDNKAIAQIAAGSLMGYASVGGMVGGWSQTFAMYNKTMMSAAADSATKAGIEGANASLKLSVEKAQMQGISGRGGSNLTKTDFYVTQDGTIIPTNKVKLNSQYDRLEVEVYSGKSIRPNNAVDDWDDFLGSNQTDINPFTGEKSLDRIWSEDGRRSIRFGNHEMDGMGTRNFHYHKETWYDDYIYNEVQRIQQK